MARIISNAKTSLAINRFIARRVWASKIRKLAKESKKRGDDPTKDSEIVPLTPNQLEFIRQEQASPNSSINTIGGALIIDEPITSSDVDTLKAAINTVIKNNDGLRIKFVKDGGILKQYATAHKPPDIPLLTFENEQELESYCDSRVGEPYGDIEGKDISNETEIFRLSDGRGGFITREHHLRRDAVGIVMTAVYIMDVYEQLKRGRKSYEGAKTSFIDYARIQQKQNPEGPGTVHVEDSDRIDAESTRGKFAVDKEITLQIKKTCNDIGKSASINIRPSKLFELANAIYISRQSGNVEKVTLFTAASGRKLKTSDELTIGMYMYGKPLEVFLDWKRTVKENVVAAKKRAKGILGVPSYSGESDLSDALWVSFRSNLGILKTLFKTPFHLYESPRRYSPSPLLMHIEDMNESGEYKVMYDYWKNTYSKEQIEQRHKMLMHIVEQMVDNPKMTLEELSSNMR